MKRLTTIIAGVLLLTACSSNSAPTPTPLPTFSETTGIFADWSRLSKPEIPAKVGTRLSEGELTEFIASDSYGPIMPYVGDVLRADGDGGTISENIYGLVTLSGCVLLDPVLDSAYIISNGDSYAFVLGKKLEQGGITTEIHALCSPDGSWCTDFIYSDIFTNENGRICLLDLQYGDKGSFIGNPENSCMMDYDGNVVMTFSDIKPEVGSSVFEDPFVQYELSNFSDGYTVHMADDKYVYIDESGKLLSSEEFDGYCANAYAFSGGRAVVQTEQNGLWGIIDTQGKWVAKPQYSSLSWLTGGAGVATTADGRSIAVDDDGNELADISGMEPSNVIGLQNGIIIYFWETDGTIRVYDRNLNDLGAKSFPVMIDNCAMFLTADGIALYDGQTTQTISGNYSMLDTSEGYITAVTEQNEGQLMDKSGKVLISLPDCKYGVGVTIDRITGAPYLIEWRDRGIVIKDQSGASIMVSNSGNLNIFDGRISVVDETGVGVMNLNGEYFFRTSADFTD